MHGTALRSDERKKPSNCSVSKDVAYALASQTRLLRLFWKVDGELSSSSPTINTSSWVVDLLGPDPTSACPARAGTNKRSSMVRVHLCVNKIVAFVASRRITRDGPDPNGEVAHQASVAAAPEIDGHVSHRLHRRNLDCYPVIRPRASVSTISHDLGRGAAVNHPGRCEIVPY